MTTKIPMSGYVPVCTNKTGKYLCVPVEDARNRNWYTREAVIYDEASKTFSRKMYFQAAFKWLPLYDLDLEAVLAEYDADQEYESS